MIQNIIKLYTCLVLSSLILIYTTNLTVPVFSNPDIEQVSYSCEIPHTSTDWSGVECELPRFSESLGELSEVNLTLEAEIRYRWFVENLNPQERSVGLEVENIFINLNTEDGLGSILTVNIPNYSFFVELLEFDGVEDFNGTSGRSYDDETLDTADGVVYESIRLNSDDFINFTESVDLEVYLGEGTIVFPLSTAGDSRCTSSANVNCRIITTASAIVTVEYSFR